MARGAPSENRSKSCALPQEHTNDPQNWKMAVGRSKPRPTEKSLAWAVQADLLSVLSCGLNGTPPTPQKPKT